MSLTFDTEPLVAFFLGEPGADEVRAMLEKIKSGAETGWCNLVNLTEFRYALLQKGVDDVDDLIDWLLESGIGPVGVEANWRQVSDMKATREIGLADAFALATAVQKGATLVAGSDKAFNMASEFGVPLRRIR